MTSRQQRLVAIGLLVAASVLPYLGTLENPFLNWDDYALVLGHPYITELSWKNVLLIFTPGSYGAYQPVRDLTYLVDYAIAGYDPVAYHVTNLLFYATTNLAAYYLLRVVGLELVPALLAALLFALHPVHVESVAWLAARKEVLTGTFFLLAAAFYVESRRPESSRRGVRYGAAILCGLLAALAKPVAVTLPAVLVLLELWVLRTWGIRRLARAAVRLLPFALISAAVTAVTIQVSVGGDTLKGLPFGGYRTLVLTWPLSTLTHLKLLLYPVGLSARYVNVYIYSWASFTFLGSVIALAALGVFTWIVRKAAPLWVLSLLWFFVTLLPVSNLVPISTLVADRYLFLPSFGLALTVGAIASALLAAPRWLRAPAATVAVAVLAALTTLTVQRVGVWETSISLWGDVVAREPFNPMGRFALGNVQAEAGHYDDAILQYRRALVRNPNSTRILLTLGYTLAVNGRYEEAEQHFERAVELEPEDEGARTALADVLMLSKRWARSLAAYDEALEAGGPEGRIRLGRARSLIALERYGEAVMEMRSAMTLDPAARGIDTYLMLGRAYLGLGRLDDARATLEEALSFEQSRLDLQAVLAETLQAMGEPARAAELLDDALEEHGETVGLLATRGLLAHEQGRYDAAVDAYQRALELNGTSGEVWAALGETYAASGRTRDAAAAYSSATRFDASGRIAINRGAFLIERGRLAEAQSTLSLARERLPDDPDVLYNLACLEARRGRRAAALAHLERAAEHGLLDAAFLLSDPDLAPLRGRTGFEAVVARVRANDEAARIP